MNILDLTSIPTERVFVVGSIDGEYQKLIDILYEQDFCYNDILVLTGDFINESSSRLLDIIHFLKDNKNCYSVKGKKEIDFLKKYQEDTLPDFLKEICDIEIISFLEKLPLVIELPNKYFVVNKGLEPNKSFTEQQSEEVFYSIPHYDIESRYYQFNNPEKKCWFDFEFEDGKICFSDIELEEIQVTAGYNLKNSELDLVCLIITDESDPIIII